MQLTEERFLKGPLFAPDKHILEEIKQEERHESGISEQQSDDRDNYRNTRHNPRRSL